MKERQKFQPYRWKWKASSIIGRVFLDWGLWTTLQSKIYRNRQFSCFCQYQRKSKANILGCIDSVYQIEGHLLFLTNWTSRPLNAEFLWQYDLSDLSSLLWNVGDKNGGEPDDAELVRLSKRLVENAVLKAVQQYLEETQNKNKQGDGSSMKTEEADRNGPNSDNNKKWDPNAGRPHRSVRSISAPLCWVNGLICTVLFECLLSNL